MTPAEQEAQRLIEWFLPRVAVTITEQDFKENKGKKFGEISNIVRIREAKQCAIKVCEENQVSACKFTLKGKNHPIYKHYEQVKTAINNYEQ